MNPCDNAEALLRVLSPARRNHYFYGKRMDVQHFQLEQDYGKHKQWLLNRLTLGKGVVCGLRVSIDGNRLCVDPGVAIDGLGREIVVPVRQCIDPLTNDGGCCTPCCEDPQPTPPPRGDGANPDNPDNPTGPANPDPPDDTGVRPRLYTLWLCYKECKTDFEPVLASECHTRQPCEAGTIVESFCLKVAPGAPLQQDPDWCAHLWPRRRPPIEPAPQPPGTAQPANPRQPALGGSGAAAGDFVATPLPAGPGQPTADDLRRSLDSRRRILCGLLDGHCDPADEDPCVPLGVFMLRGERIVRFDACLVRPRIYSNAQLLDLILCLADRLDECCNGHEPPPPPATEPMRLETVDFIARLTNGMESPVTTMANPLVDTPVDINRNMNTLRLRFSQPFAQDQRKPTAPGLGDPDFTRHNVQILPDDVLGGLPFVPGTLTIEGADTVRFDLFPDSPYVRGGGWQKGRYRVMLRGNEDLPAGKPALGNTEGTAFDGEPIAPAGGLISGNGTAGGDFVGAFVVGSGAPPATLRVRSVDFLLRDVGAAETIVATMASPLDRTLVNGRISSIRVRFTEPLAAQGPTRPITHGLDDPDFTRHNVQVLLPPRDATARGIEYLPGTVTMEAPDTLRFDVLRGSRIVNADGQWPSGTTNLRLVLRGTAQAGKPALADLDGTSLDGDPTAPAGGVISGDGAAGGDFTAAFAVVVRR
ncbi:hypothetical protein M8A51_13250 [Schlegelella sp. S2-27]|uniref:Uncharacterized protein n=1 Tax=Caldimonas mangrovi TaxID=2944811 RepID=A0ABT0YP33_9BURK|nr:hypothetical protein [Caldimonas mangrovi]MCM5680495.1 hypothetical protein [Caldimonas mangrovi]